MDKKEYEELKLEIISFDERDVITGSDTPTGDTNEAGLEP